MSRSIRSIRDVVDWGLCVGCGACLHACPAAAISLTNILSEGIRPEVDGGACQMCETSESCLSICPGYRLDADLMAGPLERRDECDHEFGPALEVWEGHASDPEVRFRGSSGAVLSALALYCLEREDMSFVLHTGAREGAPWINETVRSRTRGELLARAGSRYAPSSPCDSLALIEQSDKPCVFIGKPCDAAAAAMLARRRPALEKRLGLILTFFCAGTPNTQGTLNLLSTLEVNPDDVQTLRYRGEGWPGQFKVASRGGGQERSLSYEDSWGRLNAHRPFRCHLCPDGLGRIADIACGDAWNRYTGDGDLGCSIILVRTPKGQEILRRAIADGYVTARPMDRREVLKAQHNLLERRRHLLGRLLAMRLLRVPTPRFAGFSLLRAWLRLPPWTMARTVLGTLRRLVKRGLWRRRGRPDGATEQCGRRNAECGRSNGED